MLLQIFAGNSDRNTVVSHSLNPHIEARYIRFHPQTYNSKAACLRAELYGCPDGRLYTVNDRLSTAYVVFPVIGAALIREQYVCMFFLTTFYSF